MASNTPNLSLRKPTNQDLVNVATDLSANFDKIDAHVTSATAHSGTYVATYNVKGNGAIGDGVTDDTAAVQALIDLVGGSNPVEIYFPAGVYILSGLKLRSNMTLRGAGSGGYGLSTNYATRCSVLKLKANSALPLLADFATNNFVYSVQIRDLQIDGNKANQSADRHGIQLYDDVSGTDPLWTIRDCLILNCKGDGIYVGTFRRGTHILNCQVYDSDQNGITLASTDNTVAQTLIGSCGNHGISISAGTQHVRGNDIFSNLVGINIATGVTSCLIANNGIDRNSRQGIFCVGSRNSFVGNVFTSNSQQTNGGYSTIDLDFPNTVALGNITAGNVFVHDTALTNKPEYSLKSNVNHIWVGNTFGATAPHTVAAFNSVAQAVFLERSQGITDGADIAVGTTTGTKIGTATTQKLGFWNAPPVVQPASGDALRTALQNTGLLPAGGANLLTTVDADVSNTAAISQAKVNYLRPTGSIAQTFDRAVASISDMGALLSGRLLLVAIDLPAGKTITSISFLSRTTAAAVPTNQWFALFDNAASPVLLRQTADDTTAAWAANTVKTLNLSSTFVTTYSGLHYVGIMVAAVTVPTLAGINVSSGTFAAIAPVIAGTSTTGLTTPASFTSPALAPTGATTVPYAYVS